MTTKHKKNLKNVLNYYNEIWKEENGKIYISNAIDKELVFNYTKKANDSLWHATHIK